MQSTDFLTRSEMNRSLITASQERLLLQEAIEDLAQKRD
jgi:hypothetical protein